MERSESLHCIESMFKIKDQANLNCTAMFWELAEATVNTTTNQEAVMYIPCAVRAVMIVPTLAMLGMAMYLRQQEKKQEARTPDVHEGLTGATTTKAITLPCFMNRATEGCKDGGGEVLTTPEGKGLATRERGAVQAMLHREEARCREC